MNALQMKMLSVVIGCFFLVYAGWSLGKAQASHSLPGGTDWKALSPSERQIYGAGFTQGYRRAYLTRWGDCDIERKVAAVNDFRTKQRLRGAFGDCPKGNAMVRAPFHNRT
jgi:hypothetical protein